MSTGDQDRAANVAGERKRLGDSTRSDLLRLRFGVTKEEREAWAHASDGELRSARDGAVGELGTFAGFLGAKSHSDDVESIVEQYDLLSAAVRRLVAVQAEIRTRGG
jgi:hypothetical protein